LSRNRKTIGCTPFAESGGTNTEQEGTQVVDLHITKGDTSGGTSTDQEGTQVVELTQNKR
jgi:hypothetical protein